MTISPNPPSNHEPDPAPRYTPPRRTEPEPERAAPASGGVKIAILFGVLMAFIAANIYLFYQLNQTKSELKQENENLAAQLEKRQDASNMSAQAIRQRLQPHQD